MWCSHLAYVFCEMRKVTVKLDPEILGILINLAREERARLNAERDALDARIAAESRRIADLERVYNKHRVEGHIMRSLAALPKTKRGRMKHNHSEILVKDYLRNLNGKGASVTEISKATGTNNKTVYRLIKVFSKATEVERLPDKSWRWNDRGAADISKGRTTREKRANSKLPA